MKIVRLNRQVREYVDACAADAGQSSYSPDGFTPLLATVVNYAAQGELRRSGIPEPTSWMAMPDAERAKIRARRRRAGESAVRLVEGDGASAPLTVDGDEVA